MRRIFFWAYLFPLAVVSTPCIAEDMSGVPCRTLSELTDVGRLKNFERVPGKYILRGYGKWRDAAEYGWNVRIPNFMYGQPIYFDRPQKGVKFSLNNRLTVGIHTDQQQVRQMLSPHLSSKMLDGHNDRSIFSYLREVLGVYNKQNEISCKTATTEKLVSMYMSTGILPLLASRTLVYDLANPDALLIVSTREGDRAALQFIFSNPTSIDALDIVTIIGTPDEIRSVSSAVEPFKKAGS
jgi:hypothetical protein